MLQAEIVVIRDSSLILAPIAIRDDLCALLARILRSFTRWLSTTGVAISDRGDYKNVQVQGFSSQFILLVIARCLCLLATPSAHATLSEMNGAGSASVPVSGEQAVAEIDWTAVEAWSPIPESMPTADSDDPIEAGFARQWLERAICPIGGSVCKSISEIVSTRREPDDHWATKMAMELRQIAGTVPKAQNARVFCNSLGCLCYVERNVEEQTLDSVVLRKLKGEKGRKLGIAPSDVHAYLNNHRAGVPWELTIVRRPASTGR